jgi:hypothetical protein
LPGTPGLTFPDALFSMKAPARSLLAAVPAHAGRAPHQHLVAPGSRACAATTFVSHSTSLSLRFMFLKSLLVLGGCLTASSALAQTSAALPAADAEASKWQLFAEAGPKYSQFKNTYHSTNTLAFVPNGYVSDYSREFQLDNTYAAFAGVKAA